MLDRQPVSTAAVLELLNVGPSWSNWHQKVAKICFLSLNYLWTHKKKALYGKISRILLERR